MIQKYIFKAGEEKELLAPKGIPLPMPELTIRWNGFCTRNLKMANLNMYDASLRLGYMVKPCALLYLKTGISYGEFEATVNYPIQNWADSNKNHKKNLTGFNGALGIEFKATSTINIGCEVGYTQFKEFETKQDIISQCSFKPEQYNIKIRLSYLF